MRQPHSLLCTVMYVIISFMKIHGNTIRVIAIVVGIVALLGGAFAVATYVESKLEAKPVGAGDALSRTEINVANEDRQKVLDDSNAVPTIKYNGHNYAYNENLEVLLIMGVDDRDIIDYSERGGDARNDACVDLILVAVFDKEKKTYNLLQINRDTMVDMMAYDFFGTYRGLVKGQISLSHTYRSGLEDSCEDTRFAVSRFLYDVEISNYFCLTMDAIPIINDSVGGVTVTIEDDFSNIDPSLVMGETITLQGSQAESYVRGRRAMGNDPTNINRMARQRNYMTTLLPVLGKKTASSNSFALDLFDKLSPYMVTDCSVDQLTSYIQQFSGYTLEDIVTPDGKSVDGANFKEFYVNESSLKSIVIDLFYVQQD